MKNSIFFMMVFILLASEILTARDIYVNNLTGNDSNTGNSETAALLTIARAQTLFNAGDTIHLCNTGSVYREVFGFSKLIGKADGYVTVDGHGATVSGSDKIVDADWQMAGPGLYKNDTIYDKFKFNKEIIWRFFFVFDGKMNRMGTCMKGKSIPLKAPKDLLEKEWTFVTAEKAFYIKIDPAKKLADYNIEIPVRSNGVSIHNSTDYLTVRNLTATHVYNDGYGLSGDGKNILLENIQSIDCGDDGISAHANSGARIKGFYSSGNGTGICDTGNSQTHYEDVLIENIVGVDLYFLLEKTGKAVHSIKNSVIIANGNKQLIIESGKPDSEQTVDMDNVLFVGRKGGDTIARLYTNSIVNIQNSTFLNLDWSVNNLKLNLTNCVFSDCGNGMVCKEGSFGAASSNYYGFRFPRIGKNSFKSIAEYAPATNDNTSVFGKIDDAPKTTGFSIDKLNCDRLKSKVQNILNK
jgi:hypothetical protein